MELERYLRALEDCSDERIENTGGTFQWRLTQDWGVYDNWPILLKAKFEEVLFFLEKSDFIPLKTKKSGYSELFGGMMANLIANYNPGTVELAVYDEVKPGMVHQAEILSGEHYQRQTKDFSMGILLHSQQERQMEGCNTVRALARVIGIIGEYALEQNIPLCFPKSRYPGARMEDFARVVYYP